MKVQNIASTNVFRQRDLKSRIQPNSEANSQQNRFTTISFKGNNPDHAIFVGAEIKGMQQKGGVATVMFDYASMPGKEAAIVLPYYNGKLTHDAKGEFTGDIQVHTFPANHPNPELRGKPFWTPVNLDTTRLDDIITDTKKCIPLEEIKSTKAPWDSAEPLVLYRIKDKGAIKGIDQDIFLVFTRSIGAMKEPYANGEYTSQTAAQNNEAMMKAAFKPGEYAEFNRGTVEFLDDIAANTRTKSGIPFSPMTVSCSDSQTAYIPYFMKAKGRTDILPAYTVHNLGQGYTGETSGRVMFQNLLLAEPEATRKEIIKNLLDFPEFRESLINGTTEEFFKKYIPAMVDESGSFNPTLIPFKFANNDNGYVKGVNTVSKGYAEGLAFNDNIPSGLRKYWKSLYKSGLADGILNALNDPGISGFEGAGKGYLPGYEKEFTITRPDGSSEIVSPFRRFQESLFKNTDGTVNVTEATLKHVDEVRLDNQINFFKRLQGVYDAENFDGEIKMGDKTLSGAKVRNLLINGLDGKNVELIGHISPDVLAQFEAAKTGKGKAPSVFVSWGRLDGQKALDTVMNAFNKFRQTNPDAILVLGGPADVDDATGEMRECSKELITLAKKYAKEHEGRFVFMNGFAPGKVLSGVADAAIFPSRFAPCELTDLENKKYLSRTIVTHCQGLGDKNFDETFAGEADLMDGYKTKSEFFGITRAQIESDPVVGRIFREGIDAEGLKGYNAIYSQAQTEFTTRLANSNIPYRTAISSTMNETVEEFLTKPAFAQVQNATSQLQITPNEKDTLINLNVANSDENLLKKFALNEKISAKETQKLINIINTSKLSDTEKTRFTSLLDGTLQSNVEEKILKLLFTKENIANNDIKLTGGPLTENGFNIIRQYLANPTQQNRHLLDSELLEKGIIDDSQINIAKRIFNFDPIREYIGGNGKLSKQFTDLIKRCRDEIIENELVGCMRRAATETDANRLKMLRNHYTLQTTWAENGRLTKAMRDEGRGAFNACSEYLYKEIFARIPNSEALNKPHENFLKKLIEAIKPKPQQPGTSRPASSSSGLGDVAEAAGEAVKSSSGVSKGLKIALGAGAAVIALGGAYYTMNKTRAKSNSDGDTFKPSANPAKKTQPALQNPYLATK